MARIDTVGTYRFEVVEHGVDITKNGFPKAVLKLKAIEKWVEDAAEMEHFDLEEPSYVDWTGYDESTVAHLVLFNDAEDFNQDTALLNYEQLQTALGWDGTEFETLNGSDYEGKIIQGRVAENEYEGKVNFRVEWVDDADAPVNRELRKLDTDKLKTLGSKLRVSKKSKPSAAKPAKPKPGKPSSSPKKAAEAADDSADATPAKPASKPPKAAPPAPPAKEAEAEAEAETPDVGDDVADKESAWAKLYELTSESSTDLTDGEIGEAWVDGVSAHIQDSGKDEDEFDAADWQRVVKNVARDLAV